MRSPITWFGSKSRLATKIINNFPSHKSYVEVFGGSGSILFAKEKSPIETYNDIDEVLYNFFLVLRDKSLATELYRQLGLTPYSRKEFEQSKEQIAITDEKSMIESARRLMIKQRQSFGAHGKAWSYSRKDSSRGQSSTVSKFQAGIQRIQEATERLSSVQIECRPWEKILEAYDEKDALFYLDPPYVFDTRVDGGYNVEMENHEHEKLINAILSIKGKFVLSGFEHPIYNKLEKFGCKKISFSVIAYASDNRAKREECLWIKS